MTAFAPKRIFTVVAFLLAMTFCNVVLVLRLVPLLRNGYQDFTIFYTGARLVRTGQGSSLYNPATQYRTQLDFAHVPIRKGPLPFNHPPFEALLFLPFTWLGYWQAYLVWTALNLSMLAVILTLLRKHFPQFAIVPLPVLVLGLTSFFPVVIGLMQGQDVILLLLLVVLAVICLERGSDVRAGAILAGGLFRPHMIVPLVVLLAIRRWRVLVGFVPVAFLLAATSVAIVGWRGLIGYVQFVLHIEGSRVFGPEAAPNLRGLIEDFPGVTGSSIWTALFLFVASTFIFLVALRRMRDAQDSIVILSGLATTTAILVSFHTFVYDLSLLLPTALLLLSQTLNAERNKVDTLTAVLAVLLFLSPLYVFLELVVQRFFWFSLVLLWLHLWLSVTPATTEAPA
jgi:hypothetical protein